MASPVAELLAGVGRALDALGVRWFLFGAQAAILHGAPRLTADVDVTVDPGTRSSSDLVESLRREGFRLRVSDVDGFVETTRVLPLVHEPSRILCDVVLAGPGIEELFFDRARVHLVEGVPVPVAAADDLVAMKILAGRPKDLDDILAIVRSQGEALEVDRARATLRLLEQALDTARARGDIEPPPPVALRRPVEAPVLPLHLLAARLEGVAGRCRSSKKRSARSGPSPK